MKSETIHQATSRRAMPFRWLSILSTLFLAAACLVFGNCSASPKNQADSDIEKAKAAIAASRESHQKLQKTQQKLQEIKSSNQQSQGRISMRREIRSTEAELAALKQERSRLEQEAGGRSLRKNP